MSDYGSKIPSFDWDELPNLSSLAEEEDLSHSEEVPNLSQEHLNALCALECRRTVDAKSTAFPVVNALLDEICESIQPEDNIVLSVVERTIAHIQSTGMWADLDEIVDTMKRTRSAIRKEAIGWIAHPKRLRTYLEQEVRFVKAIERAEAALDAADDGSSLPFMKPFPPSWRP